MNKNSNKLISLLGSLDPRQRKQCAKFIASPYFNRNEDMQLLFNELSRRLSKDLSTQKEVIWKSTWKKRQYDDVRFRKYCSDLLKLIEAYVIQDELEHSPIVREKLWLSSVNRLKAKKQTEGALRNWQKQMNALQEKLPENAEKYLHLFSFEKLKFVLSNYDSRTQERSNIEQIMINLDTFYITEKLLAFNNANSTAFARQHNYKIDFIEQIIKFIDDNTSFLDRPAIAMQYFNFKIEKFPEIEENYYKFKENLLVYSEEFSKPFLHNLFQTALNYCSRKINSGNVKYIAEYLDVYKNGLAKEAVFEGDKLNPIQFKTTVLLALRQGDYTWAKNYIENYQDRIPLAYRENAVNLNLATFYFYQKDYDRAMGYLRDVEYENVIYNINAKIMLLAIYYETDEFDALESFFDSFQAYLNRHKEIPKNYKTPVRNLMSITRKMTRVIPGDKKAVEKLRKEVEETKAIASLNWVREKLDELA